MAFTAETEQTKLVVDHAELTGVSDPAAKAGQRVVRDGTTRQRLDTPAALTDQVGVMPGELFSQLVAKAATGCVYGPQEPRRYQKMDGSIDGYPVDGLLGHSAVNLLDREVTVARADYLQDGAARSGQAMTLSGEQVGKRAERSNRC
jgi:hypothetical protein